MIKLAIILTLLTIVAAQNCAQNETYSPCPSQCPKKCGDKATTCSLECNKDGGCVCQEGFVRNVGWNSGCIKEEDCPECGENEFYSCGSACDTTCENVGAGCPIVNIVCNTMCYCKPGYARDGNNRCIPLKDCPVKQCNRDPNATFSTCQDVCPKTCKNRNVRLCMDACYPGCNCNEGYVLNDDKKCVKIEECVV